MRKFRRIVTGHNDQGRSIVVEDGVTPGDFCANEAWPTLGASVVWVSDRTPADNLDEGYFADSPLRLLPAPGGSTFLMVQIPPESELDAMTPEQRALAITPAARGMPDTVERDISRHQNMHVTETTDYIVVVQGEVTLILEDEEVVLRPFDTVVQRGTNHTWVNRGTEPVLMVGASVDAAPIDRDKHPVHDRALKR